MKDFEEEIVNSPNYSQIIEELKQNGWILCFQKKENNCVYFRTSQTDVLNSELGDIVSEISVIESEILFELQVMLLEKYSQQLKDISDDIYVLDAYFSLAIAAINHGLHSPVIRYDSKPYISFKNGGFDILKDFNSLKEDAEELSKLRCVCITGLNGSGKTYFLKLVGIIVYLAQIGSYVPAENCVISVFDKILTKFSRYESIQLSKIYHV